MLALAAATLVLGQSVEHRPIRAFRSGDGPRRILVVGSVHGDEPGGHAVIRALRARRTPAGMTLYTVRAANPDGLARGTRVNANGVDLNRNFGHRWRRSARGRYYSGPRAFSEPESRALRGFIEKVNPHVTVWLHQPYGIVVDTPGARRGCAARGGLSSPSRGPRRRGRRAPRRSARGSRGRRSPTAPHAAP